MALQSIGQGGGLWIPDPQITLNTSPPAFTNSTALTVNTHKYAYIFRVPKTGSLHKIHLRYGSAITSGASTRMQAYFETVSTANGDPSGSAYGGSVVGTSGIQPAASTWDTITLGTDATVSAVGDVVAAVITFQTFNASDSITFNQWAQNMTFGYTDVNTGSWTKVSSGSGVMAIEYSDGTFAYIPNSFPIKTVTNTSYNSGSATDEYALVFTFPFPCRINGMAAQLTCAAGADFDVVIYSGTTAQTGFPVSLDGDQVLSTSHKVFMVCPFPTPFSCAANTQYSMSIKPTTANSVTLQRYTANSAAIFDQMSGGQAFFEQTRVDAGAWTQATTIRPAIFLFLDKFDDAVQTGGVKVYPGMEGGCTG